MSAPATTRVSVSLPTSGKVEVPVTGYTVMVEYSPDSDPSTCAVLRIGQSNGSPFPAYTGAQYTIPDRFERLYVDGDNAASGTLYLLIVNTKGVRIESPGTASV